MKATVSSSGQITIPKHLRERLGLHPGEILDLDEEGGRLVATKLTSRQAADGIGGNLMGCVETDAAMVELRGRPDPV